MLHAQNGVVRLDDDTMDYISFGSGRQTLILLPGLGDGLRTVKGMALPFAWMYRRLAKAYTVYLFSRRNHLPPVYGSGEMAADTLSAMDALAIPHAHVCGISQGGTIAQQLAIRYPARVDRLVLAATYARPNDTITAVLSTWIAYAKAGDYPALFLDTAAKTYSESHLQRNGFLYRLLSHTGAPKDFSRFLTQARACLTHDVYELLPSIQCPTLVIGGQQDKIVSTQASVELSARIPNCQLFLYEQWGHGLYEEAPDFWDRVTEFFGTL